ncbi:alpha/beta hydrolase [Terrabacter sp. Soil811]|uniref:alpha/beta fold hydrolase n=1 Tax=Terrabacter sp. Soil811 TaxID=1736419 RepID=UPI000701E4A9|nr:alpha/beta hydrolase [Terrabacter sp. Soil811]KRF46458.1 alpha/beta hydrolase [Terrabacter sp. Soil811]
MIATQHRTVDIDGLTVFYREAGHPEAPTLVLLHGFPTSSRMFRNLIPALADRYHVIAPDHVGFGESSMPSLDEFPYTFDALADVTTKLLEKLKVGSFAMYVHDYGAPIGWRLALAQPGRVSAIITQSGNGYEAGFVEEFWEPIWAYAKNPGPETEPGVRFLVSAEATRWQYLHGVHQPDLVDPDCWAIDQAFLDRPGNDRVQFQLFHDYINNIDGYPALHEYFRQTQVPLLAVWGANDKIFGAPGAPAFKDDLPDAEIHLLNAGHFALESQLDTISSYIRGFLGHVL